MPSYLEYFMVLFLSGLGPGLLLLHPHSHLKKHLPTAAVAITASAIPFLIWDVWATHRGHWQFNPVYRTGWQILNLPVEEILFFFVIPFCCLYVWEVIKTFTNKTDFINQLLLRK